MSAIYWEIERVRFFDLPSWYSAVPLGLSEIMIFAPSNTYRLEVRHGGVGHTVTWKDSVKPTTPEADRLRGLFQLIQRVIDDHPDVKRLPKAIGGCE
jgi:hypothetical protein